MSVPVLEILNTGMGISLQDQGRRGWKRFGVPVSGAMDDHAAIWANRLLGNDDSAPVLELLMQGAELKLLRNCRIAVTGAEAGAILPSWHAKEMKTGQRLHFPANRDGIWTYITVPGGFSATKTLGSVSRYERADLGPSVKAGDILYANSAASPQPSSVAGSMVIPKERRNYQEPGLLRVYPGPQWAAFDDKTKHRFLEQEWELDSRSDRVGYRLLGKVLSVPLLEMQSEPMMVGSVQVPPDGRPIVLMRDGPTVGGYPRIGQLAPETVSQLAQCKPGVKFRWKLIQNV